MHCKEATISVPIQHLPLIMKEDWTGSFTLLQSIHHCIYFFWLWLIWQKKMCFYRKKMRGLFLDWCSQIESNNYKITLELYFLFVVHSLLPQTSTYSWNFVVIATLQNVFDIENTTINYVHLHHFGTSFFYLKY